MANLFKDLPHLLGTITNLDGNASLRALASIRAELARRQALFAEQGVNHINQYQKQFKEGQVSEPLPHLFIISDEFAELKVNQPDFMTELVSTARIGRSLGVHLILATQKPAGVVSDQIWSNSTFRIALKVADRQDSSDVLHTPDAAEITQTGRAYLQVGNNEVYELFQSAYSGADYQPDKDQQDILDETIYAVNDLGQLQPLTRDLSGLDQATTISEIPSELDAIVQEIKTIVTDDQIQAVARPWLEPLGEEISVTDYRKESFKDLWKKKASHIIALVGMVDIPSKQRQEVGKYDITKDGNLAIFGGPGMGKSSLIQTIVMDLARQFSPETLNFYIFDFGASALFSLRQLPHVADFFSVDDEEKLTKFIPRLKKEMSRRKRLFNRYDVNNKDMYEAVSGDEIPQIVVVIDNYEGHKEIQSAALRTEIDSFYQTLSRDGFSLGISMIVTGNRQASIKQALITNMKRRLVLKLTEEGEARNLIGRSSYTPDDLPGRGLIRIDDVEVFQAFLSHPGQDDVTRLKALQAEITEMDASWQGDRPKAIPIVPRRLSLDAFAQASEMALAQPALPIGLTLTDLEPVSLPLGKLRHLVYTSDNRDNLEAMTAHLIRAIGLLEDVRLTVFDTSGDSLDDKTLVSDYYNEPKDFVEIFEGLIADIYTRMGQNENTPWFVLIPAIEDFAKETKLEVEQVEFLIDSAHKAGVYLIFGGASNYILSNVSAVPKALRSQAQYMVFAMRIMDQAILPKTYQGNEPYPDKDIIYLHDRRKEVRLKITKDNQEEEE